jgi:hypothetical protein
MTQHPSPQQICIRQFVYFPVSRQQSYDQVFCFPREVTCPKGEVRAVFPLTRIQKFHIGNSDFRSSRMSHIIFNWLEESNKYTFVWDKNDAIFIHYFVRIVQLA